MHTDRDLAAADGRLPDQEQTLSLPEAATYLGVSPTSLARLLDSGALDWVATEDVRLRRVRVSDLDAHREDLFALRQHLAGLARARRLSVPGPDLVLR